MEGIIIPFVFFIFFFLSFFYLFLYLFFFSFFHQKDSNRNKKQHQEETKSGAWSGGGFSDVAQYHGRVCNHCLRSLATPQMVFPASTSEEERCLPLLNDARFWPSVASSVVTCERCDRVIYCDAHCQAHAMQDHARLCVGNNIVDTGQHPMLQYEQTCKYVTNNRPLPPSFLLLLLLLYYYIDVANSDDNDGVDDVVNGGAI